MRKTTGFVMGLLLATGLGGCEKTIELEQVPAFYDPEIQTVAVAPFNNRSGQPAADEMVAARLATALTANRTYKVIGPSELKARLREVNLTLPTDDANAVAAAVGELRGIDAVIVGTVDAYDVSRYSFVDVDHYNRYGPGGPAYGFGHYRNYGYYQPSVTYYNSSLAYLAVRASMLRVPDGKPLRDAAVAAGAESVSRQSRMSLAQARLREAVDEVVDQLVLAFARTPVEVKVSPGQVLRTARGDPKGRLEFTNDFTPADTEMVAVVELPPVAARNEFRVTVTPKGFEQVLAEHSFLWGDSEVQRRLVFSPSELSAVAGGEEDFLVRLYSRDRLLVERDFEIEP